MYGCNHKYTHVDVVSSELFVQALTERTKAELSGREGTRRFVPAPTRRRSGKDQCTALTSRVQLILFEESNCEPRKCEGSADVGFERLRDLLVRDFEERLPNTISRIENSRAKAMC